jgi:MFS family permease
MTPLSQEVLMETFPPEEQAVGMSIWGLGMMVVPGMGPILGGWITDNYSWRWVFYINVPMGLIAAVMVPFSCTIRLIFGAGSNEGPRLSGTRHRSAPDYAR